MTQSPEDSMVRLHHVGYVVRSIEEVADRLARSIGALWDRQVIADPLQKARVSFLAQAGQSLPLFELVQPEGDSSPVANFLKRGGGLHHICYEVKSLGRQLESSRANGDTVVQSPLPAVAFHGRRIAWVFTKERLLLEFLESA